MVLFKGAPLSGLPNQDLAEHFYPLVEIGDEARSIIDRVAGVPAEGPLAQEAAEEAIWRYFQALGLAPRPIRWMDRGSWPESCAAGFSEVRSKGLRYGLTLDEDIDAEREGEKSVKRVRKVVEKVGQAAAYVGLSKLVPSYAIVYEALQEARGQRAALDKVGERIEDFEAKVGVPLFGLFSILGGPRERSKDVQANQVYSALAASRAMAAAFWSAIHWAATQAGADRQALDRVAQISIPFVDAVDHGLWLYWITPDEVIAVARKPG